MFPPVKLKIFSSSGGGKTSYPTIDFEKFGAYESISEKTLKYIFISCLKKGKI
jgi:hypothetical protein